MCRSNRDASVSLCMIVRDEASNLEPKTQRFEEMFVQIERARIGIPCVVLGAARLLRDGGHRKALGLLERALRDRPGNLFLVLAHSQMIVVQGKAPERIARAIETVRRVEPRSEARADAVKPGAGCAGVARTLRLDRYELKAQWMDPPC